MKTLEERKESQREASRKWRLANKEKHRAAVNKWKHTPAGMENARVRANLYASQNREKEKLKSAEWRKANPEKAKKSSRSNYLKRREITKEYNRKYREANREQCRLWQNDRKARKRAGGGRLSRGYIKWLLIVQNNQCVTCRVNFDKAGYQLDHIVPISKGGTHCDANVWLLCPTCNKRKSNRSLSDFLAILEMEND